MRLTARFLLAFLVALTVALGGTTWLAVRRESAQLDRDLRTDSLLIGQLVARAYEMAMRSGDPRAADESIEAANQVHTEVTVRRVDPSEVPPGVREALAAGLSMTIHSDRASSDGRLDTFVPVRLASKPGALQVTASLRTEHRQLSATKRRAIVTSLVAFLLAALSVSVLGVMVIARPTRALIAKTVRVAEGDFGGPVEIAQRDELGDLAKAINAMSDQLATAQARVVRENAARLAAVEQLRHADRLMTVGRLSAGIAHELGTPLNVIEGRAKMIQQGEVEGDEISDSARIIVEQSRRITAIVRQLLDFARRGERARQPVDIVAIAQQARRLLAATARRADVDIEEPTRTEPLMVLGDEAQLVQVVTNLVTNAIHATPPGGRVTLDVNEVMHTPRTGGPAVPRAVIAVRDTGTGMDAATIERIFEPFFTTKGVGRGTGLGLSVVHGIVEDHQGWVDVESTEGEGSCFSVYLPMPAAS